MGVRLVIGRAGTGKTALCAREIRAEMARAAIGGALLWIVPEQGTFSTERVLLTADGAGFGAPPRGTFRAQVLSFRRLAMLIVRETGRGASGPVDGPAGGMEELIKPMDAVARRVLLEEMLRREKGKLTVFAGVADRPGFAERLDGTLRELRQHGHSAKSLRELVDRQAIEPGGARRLLDLATLLEAWEAEMTDAAQWDFEQLMQCATDQMHASALITGAATGERARIWVDATSAMSGQEVRFLAALARHAEEATVTLLADPDSPALRPVRRGQAVAEPAGLFARTERLHRRLLDSFARNGIGVKTPVVLRETWRFIQKDLARTEAAVFAEVPMEAISHMEKIPADLFAGPEERAPQPAGEGAREGEGVEVWSCGDPETEVRAVAQRIRELVMGDGGERGRMRYRQIAVIAADLEGYQDAVQRIFRQHGIAHFIDQKRSAAHHPLAEFLRSAVAVARSGWQRDEVMLFFKTGLAGISAEDVALVENYVIEHGILRGGWQERWTWLAPNVDAEGADWRVPESATRRLERANEIREKTWEGMSGFIAACGEGGGDSPQDGDTYVRALRELMRTMAVAERLVEWKHAAAKRGDLELAQIHEQIGREAERLLEMLERALSGRQRTLGEFERLLSGALESLAIGLIPPTVDQVVVSSVMRSRVPEMEAVFVIGAVEGQFPKVLPEDPILSDEQREAFNRAAAEPIGEGSGQELLEMPFFDYVAMTRSRRLLVVSYPVADRQGKALRDSRHIGVLHEVLGKNLKYCTFDAEIVNETQRVCTADDLMGAFARQARQGGGRMNAQLAAVARWIAGQKDAAIAQGRLQLQEALAGETPTHLAADLAELFFPKDRPLRLNVSRLERFSACPLQYFLHYTLGLSPRKEFQIDSMSRGSLVHRVLELFYRNVILHYPQWPEVAEAEVTAILRQAIAEAVKELHAEAESSTPGYQKMRGRLEWTLNVQLEADRRRAKQGEMRPSAVEVAFDRPGRAETDARGRIVRLPVLAWRTPGGVQLELNGKIDRIDQHRQNPKEMAVIDYKTGGSAGLKLDHVFQGLDLQLPTYALALRELAKAEPVAAFFLRLGMSRKKAKDGEKAPRPADDAFYQQYQPRGIVDLDFAEALDRQIHPAGSRGNRGVKSAWYNIAFKADGGSKQRSDLLDHQEFQWLLDFTQWKLAALADELTRGRVAASPYRMGTETPCDFCDFTALCDFDPTNGNFRSAATMKRDACLAEMRDLTGG